MFDQAIDRLNLGISSLKSFISINNEMRILLGSIQGSSEPSLLEYSLIDMRNAGPSVSQWRVMDHCLAVSRLYALYEQFSENLLHEWIEFRSAGRTFASLPESLQASYKEGFLHISSMITKARYEHLSFAEIIKNYSLALGGETTYKLTTEFLTHHRNNLRWADLCELCAQCGIENFSQWISQNPSVIEHFQTQRKIQELTAAKLKVFIDYRNDAAHGAIAVDEILGSQQLLDLANFIQIICEALHGLIRANAVEILIGDGKAHKVGVITKTYSDNVAIVLLEGVKFKVGDKVIVATECSCNYRSIHTLKIEDTDYSQITVANPTEVGIKFDQPVQKRSKIIFVE